VYPRRPASAWTIGVRVWGLGELGFRQVFSLHRLLEQLGLRLENWVYMRAHIYISISLYIYNIYIYIYICSHVYMYTYMYMNMYVYIYINIYVYT